MLGQREMEQNLQKESRYKDSNVLYDQGSLGISGKMKDSTNNGKADYKKKMLLLNLKQQILGRLVRKIKHFSVPGKKLATQSWCGKDSEPVARTETAEEKMDRQPECKQRPSLLQQVGPPCHVRFQEQDKHDLSGWSLNSLR